MVENVAFEVKITRNANTHITIKTCEKWEAWLATWAQKENASTRIRSAFGAAQIYRTPDDDKNLMQFTRELRDVGVQFIDDYSSTWLISPHGTAGDVYVNLAVLRAVGSSNGITLTEPALVGRDVLERVAKALARAYKHIFYQFVGEVELTLTLSEREVRA